VIDELQVRVVRDPAPHRAAADLPRFRRPGAHAEVLAAIARVERLECRADEHVRIRPCGIGAPRFLTRRSIERDHPTTYAILAAAVADEHFAGGNERRHGDRLALVDVAELLAPALLTATRVQRDRLTVQRREIEAVAGERDTAINGVAAGNALCSGNGLRVIAPLLRRAGLAEIEGVDVIRKRRDEVHRVAADDWRCFVSPQHTGREGEFHP
jgi:hypothetical protein